MKRQASYHGEIGANGRSYQKGQFIAEQAENNTVKSSSGKATNKVQVAPYQWEVRQENRFPIFSRLSTGVVRLKETSFKSGDWKVDRNTIIWEAVDFLFDGDRELFLNLCDRFDDGDRWL